MFSSISLAFNIQFVWCVKAPYNTEGCRGSLLTDADVSPAAAAANYSTPVASAAAADLAGEPGTWTSPAGKRFRIYPPGFCALKTSSTPERPEVYVYATTRGWKQLPGRDGRDVMVPWRLPFTSGSLFK